MRRILVLVILFPLVLLAQENVIPNGDFEKYNNERPQGWIFSRFLYYEKSYDSHNGTYSAKVYANGGAVTLASSDYQNYNIVDVISNSKYDFSYWYKGQGTRNNITPVISWYRDNKLIKKEYFDKEEVELSSRWKQKNIQITVPVGVNKAGVSFLIKEDNGAYVYIDDISMIFKEKLVDDVPVPSGVHAVPFQREIELSWSKEADPSIQWEVVVDDGTPLLATSNKFTIENLELNHSYKIKVRAKSGNTYSDYADEINIKTKGLEYAIDSFDRIPRLRTLGIDADIPKSIKLYYIDLANKNAKITYYIDDKKVTPNGDTLTFDKTGRQKLKIEIEESADLQWEIEYNVNVK